MSTYSNIVRFIVKEGNEEKFLEASKFLETLEDHEDVQKVYSNLETLE